MKTIVRLLLGMVVASSVWPAPAGAAVREVRTAIQPVVAANVRYPDAAYDPANNVFLAVTGSQSQRPQGAWVSTGGAQLGAAFNLTTTAVYQSAPRAVCGEEGKCLVVWHQGDVGTVPMGRVVSYTGGFLTAPFALGAIGSSWEMGMGVAYSPTANEFLVTWMGDFNRTTTPNDIYIVRVSLAGQLLGTAVSITDGASYEREPAVAYNPVSDEFVISYAGTYYENGVEIAYMAAQRVKGGSLVGSRIMLDTSGSMLISSAEYNPATQSVVVVWRRSPTKIYSKSISAAGVAGSLVVVSSTHGAYDALDLAYNPVSESFLVVTHGATGIENVAIEVASNLTPSPAFTLTASPPRTPANVGNYNPRIASSQTSPRWMSVASLNFNTLVAQFATSTAGWGHCGDCSGGGGGGGTPNPAMSLDLPTANQVVTGNFTVSGWAIDRGASAGTGVSSVRIYASADSGAGTPVLLGTAAYGGARSDIGTLYGAQFTNSGYSFTASLTGGRYLITAEALSTVSNTWNQTDTAIVGVSQAVVTLDSPAQNAAVRNYFSVAGWAVDPASATGTGVDVVAIYGYPNPGSNTPPQLLAIAPYGYARPDVATALGNARFTNSGFNATVGNLTPATYQIVAFAHSTASGAWFPVTRIVTAGRGRVITIDTPANLQTVNSGFTIRGWATNLASTAGTGVNLVQVWAYPNSGAAPIFLGTATYGTDRTDVGAAFGTQFRYSGFTLATNPLTSGGYVVVVFARNSVTGVFDNARTVGITIP